MKRKLSIIVAILIGLFVLYKFFHAFNNFGGSYPFAETYELNFPESQVDSVIKELKTERPELNVPKDYYLELRDGRQDSVDHWYHVYFYYADKNEIVYCWTRDITRNSTTLAFVSLTKGNAPVHWKNINDDFGYFENKEVKKEFETKILNDILKRLEK